MPPTWVVGGALLAATPDADDDTVAVDAPVAAVDVVTAPLFASAAVTDSTAECATISDSDGSAGGGAGNASTPLPLSMASADWGWRRHRGGSLSTSTPAAELRLGGCRGAATTEAAAAFNAVCNIVGGTLGVPRTVDLPVPRCGDVAVPMREASSSRGKRSASLNEVSAIKLASVLDRPHVPRKSATTETARRPADRMSGGGDLTVHNRPRGAPM